LNLVENARDNFLESWHFVALLFEANELQSDWNNELWEGEVVAKVWLGKVLY
jgi:hypothetical protein